MAQTAEEKKAARETKRLARKRDKAGEHVPRFEDELSQHEIVKARLEATPAELRPEDYDNQLAASVTAIAVLKASIATSLKTAENKDKAADREKARLKRKKTIAASMAIFEEDKRNDAELDLARLQAIPVEIQDDSVTKAIKDAEKDVARRDFWADKSLAEVDKITE